MLRAIEEDGEVHSQTPERSALSSKSQLQQLALFADCAAKWERRGFRCLLGLDALCDRALTLW